MHGSRAGDVFRAFVAQFQKIDSCEEGLAGLECLGRAESWQERWPILHREHVRLSTYPFTPSGLVHRTREALLAARARRAGESSDADG